MGNTPPAGRGRGGPTHHRRRRRPIRGPRRRIRSARSPTDGTWSPTDSTVIGSSTATGMVRPALRAYFATSGATARRPGATSSHVPDRSTPVAARAFAGPSPAPRRSARPADSRTSRDRAAIPTRCPRPRSPPVGRGSAHTWPVECRSADPVSRSREPSPRGGRSPAGRINGRAVQEADPTPEPRGGPRDDGRPGAVRVAARWRASSRREGRNR
jgi:hypothetical protein